MHKKYITIYVYKNITNDVGQQVLYILLLNTYTIMIILTIIAVNIREKKTSDTLDFFCRSGKSLRLLDTPLSPDDTLYIYI